MARIFITGANGMLGRSLVRVLEEDNQLLPTDLPGTDVTEIDSLISQVSDFGPEMVIHLASMTDVDRCEEDPESAFRINSLGTRNVALACAENDAVMVYISTGSIYNGKKETPYTEYDNPDPVNAYGRSKYFGEVYMRDILNRFYIFYTCWLFGGAGEDKKFIPKILELASNRDVLDVVDDKYGSPTYTNDLAREISGVIRTGYYGRYHCANSGFVNRYEEAVEILKIAGITGCSINPVSSDRFNLPAPRPRSEALANYNLSLMGRKPMRSWREALSEYIVTELA
ncbi:MAG: dTDP-4-dehydrorhamnose reductase [Candidatus Latescibacteria bacterium]|nr:dTDP-4-dehydrorhamnose reductase [bacterium]MBD3424707.1 dTDP-4-dehydrorhamnose reductase [Candidatus Latescibacterota bacterium]